MNIVTVGENVWVYVFEDSIIITAVAHEGKVILLDCGMLEHGQKVREDLDSKGLTVTGILFTHYHPDHVGGSTLFDHPILACSKTYQPSYDMFIKQEDDEVILEVPTMILEDSGEVEIDGMTFEVFNGEGHSGCSLMYLYNSDILVVGDLMMNAEDDRKSLPSLCSGGSLLKHITSLEKMKELSPRVLVGGHGAPIIGEEKVRQEIDLRLNYLLKIKDNPEGIPLEACIEGDLEDWVLKEAHESNIYIYNLELGMVE